MNPLSQTTQSFDTNRFAGFALVVDSNSVGQNILARYLSNLGFYCRGVTPQEINFEAVQRGIYNLILLSGNDISDSMVELSMKIHHLNKHQVTFVCANFSMDYSAKNIKKHNISDIFFRPFSEEVLAEKIILHTPECFGNFDPALPMEMIHSDSSIQEGLAFLENNMFQIFKERIPQEIINIEKETELAKRKKIFHKLKSSYAQFGFNKSQSFFEKLSHASHFTAKDLNYIKKQTLADISALTKWIDFQKKYIKG